MKKMRRSLSSYLPDGSGGKRKQMMLAATGVVLGAIILVAIVAVALTVLNKGPGTPVATPTPEPTITPTPEPTITPVPSPTPTPTPTSGRVYDRDGPFVLNALLKNGQLIVGITVAPGAATVNVSNLSISIMCEDRTYDNVWTLKPMDWDKFDGDTILKTEDNIASIIDTVALGIPQGRPLTVLVTRYGDIYQRIAVAPTN